MRLPDHPPTLRERGILTVAAQKDPNLRQAIRERCRRDPAFFINFACWTFDPRKENPHIPFILYPYQIDLIHWLEERLVQKQDGVIDKSRDMGVSWVIMAWLLWHWLFDESFQALIGSRAEYQVDNRLIDSHFGRLEYLIQRLPAFLKPQGFSFRQHRHHMKLVNPENGAAIKGEASHGNFGRQGRFNVVFFDELAFWDKERQFAAWRSASEATRTRIAVSTPNGAENLFYQLVHEGKTPHLRIHWSLHPEKDEEWYEKQRQRLTDVELAAEVDISYHAADAELVYPEWQDVVFTEVSYCPSWPLYVSWDFGFDTSCCIWWQRDLETGRVVCLDAVERKGVTIDWFVPFFTGEIPPDRLHLYTVEDRAKVEAHRGWGHAVHFGDPAGGNRHVGTGLSVLDVLRNHGIYVYTNKQARDFVTRRHMTAMGLRETVCNIADGPVSARIVDERMRAARKGKDGKPLHDVTSHIRSAVEYFFVNVPPFRRREKPQAARRLMRYDVLFGVR